MPADSFTRREVLQTGSAAAAITFAQMSMPNFVFADEKADEELVPFLNMPRSRPKILDWETLDDWITPQDQVFSVKHYNTPTVSSEKYQLEVTGLVENPKTFSLDQLQALPRKDQLMTLECSGNGSNKGFLGAIYNSKWTGTPLAPLLKACGIKDEATEIAFIGHDEREETLRKGTGRELIFNVPFGRSMSVKDALNLNVLVAYQRDGKPIEKRNGAPVRLIVPGWYGIANVKWLRRIEVRNRRYVGRFMGRDYVTVRGERQGDKVVFVETSVARMNLKSIVARVTRRPTEGGLVPTKAYGAVWGDGTEIKRVEVQVNKVVKRDKDDIEVEEGKWQAAKIDEKPQAKYSWRFFSIDLGKQKPGEYTVVSRAIDVNGRVQPSADDDEIALKKTYWEAYQQWPREIELEA